MVFRAISKATLSEHLENGKKGHGLSSLAHHSPQTFLLLRLEPKHGGSISIVWPRPCSWNGLSWGVVSLGSGHFYISLCCGFILIKSTPKDPSCSPLRLKSPLQSQSAQNDFFSLFCFPSSSNQRPWLSCITQAGLALALFHLPPWCWGPAVSLAQPQLFFLIGILGFRSWEQFSIRIPDWWKCSRYLNSLLFTFPWMLIIFHLAASPHPNCNLHIPIGLILGWFLSWSS